MDVFELVAKLRLDSSEYESGLKGAKGSAEKNLGTASKVLGKLNAGVNKVLAVGAAAAGAAVAGMTAFAKASVQTGMQFDSAMSQVAATMGTTVDQIGDLRDFAQQMGATTAFSATQAAEALNYMALAGYDAETSMQTLPTVLNLAAAGNMDLARASDMVTDAQSALGLTLDQTTEMVDQMAATASKSNTSVSQLGDAFLTIGATARNLKGGTTELATVLGVLADNGIKGAEGGTHLRNMILSLQNPTKDAQAALDKLNISLYDGDGKMRSMIDIVSDLQVGLEGMDQASKDAIISGIFNKTDLAAVNALVGTSRTRFDELTTAIKESKGAAEDMANTQLDNLSGDITLLKSAAEGAKIAFSDGLSPALRDIVQRVTAFLSKKSTQNALNDIGKKVGEVAKALTTKLGNALPRIASLFDDGGKKIKIAGAAFTGFVIAVKAAVNPLGAVVSALGLLAAADITAGLTADSLANKFSILTKEQKDNINATLDGVDAYNDLQDSRAKQNAAIDTETSRTQALWQELKHLADENGHVSDKNKDRANYILGQLNEALGTEYSMNGNIITQYKEMQTEVLNLIKARSAERKLSAAEASYDAAKEGLSGVAETIYDLNRDIDSATGKLSEYNAQLEALRANQPDGNATLGQQTRYAQQESDLLGLIAGQEAVINARSSALEKAKAAEQDYYETITAYEAAELAFSEQHYNEVDSILSKDVLSRTKHAIETGRVSEEQFNELKRQADITKDQLERYQQNLAEGQEGYTEQGLEEIQSYLSEIEAAMLEAAHEMAADGNAAAEGFSSEFGAVMLTVPDVANQSMSDVLAKLDKQSSFYSKGSGDASSFVRGWNANMTGLKYPDGNGGWKYQAIGLDYVPFNNYPAMLHKGEAVLNAREAEEWRKGNGGDGGSVMNINQYINVVPQTPVEFAAATEAAFEQARWGT